jgi:hypothetical protein
MSGLKTSLRLVSITLALCAPLSPARALPTSADDQLQFFASCVGRMSALMEHQWMFDGPASEITESHRETLISLMSAVMPAGTGRKVLAWRIEAKLAHSTLLTRATFNENPDDARWAELTAVRHTSECSSILLG